LLEADIRTGRNISALPQDLAQTMLANARHSVHLDSDIEGEVALCCNAMAGRCCSMEG